MSDHRGKKRKKQYYKQCAAKKSRRLELEVGMCGFLLTCNNREKDAVREAYSLLNQYADQLYGAEKSVKNDAGNNSGSESEEEDLEKALQKEVTTIKDMAKTERRFQVVDTGANNVLFIRSTLDQPHKLADAIISDIYETQTSKSRYIMRFLPVIATCKTHGSEKILQCAKQALTPFFGSGQSHSFSILFKARNNDKVTRNDILKPLAQILFDMNPENKTDYECPQFVISVDVIRNVCCISIAKDFYKLSKYNLQELASIKGPKVADPLPQGKSDKERASVQTASVNSDADAVIETEESSPSSEPATTQCPSGDAVIETEESSPSSEPATTQCPSGDADIPPTDVSCALKPSQPQDGSVVLSNSSSESSGKISFAVGDDSAQPADSAEGEIHAVVSTD